MTPGQVMFFVNAVVTLFAGIMVVLARKLVHAALWLVLALLGVAVVFGFLEASFFAVVQVLVYVGAIAILILFAVMLTRQSTEDPVQLFTRRFFFTVAIVLALFVGFLFALSSWSALDATSIPLTDAQHSLTDLGLALVDPNGYVLPFEVTSILLLTALVGAIYIAFERKGEQQ